MRAFLALTKASFQVAMTYRLTTLFSILGLFTMIIPMYFVTTALQPTMANSIKSESTNYFSFVFVGMLVYLSLPTFLRGLSSVISTSISSGTLEAMLATPTRLPTVLAGLIGYDIGWALVKMTVFLLTGFAFGFRLAPAGLIPGLGILILVLIAYFAIGMVAAAMVVAFRTSGPLVAAALGASVLLGGVYYPTGVVPAFLQGFTDFVPLSYGLRALRRLWLNGVPLSENLSDILHLIGIDLWLLAIGVLALTVAIRDARRRGTLGMY